jgi:hypothetical protein
MSSNTVRAIVRLTKVCLNKAYSEVRIDKYLSDAFLAYFPYFEKIN